MEANNSPVTIVSQNLGGKINAQQQLDFGAPDGPKRTPDAAEQGA